MSTRLLSPVFALGLALVCLPVASQTNIGSVQLPQAPQFPQGQDSIRAADGTTCTTSTAPRDKFMDVGVVGGGTSGVGVENAYPYVYQPGAAIPSNQYGRMTAGVYARIVINLDPEKPKLDCARLYELEIQRLRLEIEQMKLIGVGKAVGGK